MDGDRYIVRQIDRQIDKITSLLKIYYWLYQKKNYVRVTINFFCISATILIGIVFSMSDSKKILLICKIFYVIFKFSNEQLAIPKTVISMGWSTFFGIIKFFWKNIIREKNNFTNKQYFLCIRHHRTIVFLLISWQEYIKSWQPLHLRKRESFGGIHCFQL